MVKTLLYSVLFFLSLSAPAQTILFVDDNDNNPSNSDDFLLALQSTSYSANITRRIVVSDGNPDLTTLNNYDLVIWYTSTDGGGLGLWDLGTTDNISSYLSGGGKLWMVGLDFLYGASYSPPVTFNSGDFVYDVLGLESYNMQSYADDGNVGVPQVDATTSAPVAFPATLTWVFSTLWYADGITGRMGTTDFYKMGPSTYSYAGQSTMTHFANATTDALVTVFDPVLIGNTTDRNTFTQASLDYLANFTLSANEFIKDSFSVTPNPSNNELKIKTSNNADFIGSPFEMYDILGNLVIKGKLNNMTTTVNIANLKTGMYLLKLGQNTKKIIKN